MRTYSIYNTKFKDQKTVQTQIIKLHLKRRVTETSPCAYKHKAGWIIDLFPCFERRLNTATSPM